MRIIKLIVVGLLVASVGAVSQPAPLPSDLDLTVSVEVRPDKDGEWQAVEHTGDVAETEFGTVSQTHHQRGPETGTTWQIDNPTENPIQWRVRVSIPLTDLPRTKGQARVMYGRADQILDLDLAADTLPVPLGNGITPNINQTLWSVAFAKGKKTLRVDLDRRGGGWQMDRDGDDLQFTYQTHVWPPGPSAAAMHVTTRPVQTSPERLDLIDWLDGPHSVTARMSHRGVYFPDEPIELHLRGVSLEPNVLPCDYRVVDYFGDEVASGSCRLFYRDRADDLATAKLPVTKTGAYRVEVTGPNDLRKEVTFGVVPEPQRLGDDDDSVMGTHAILSNPYFPRLAARTGMRWNRLWGGNISSAALWSYVEPEPGVFQWKDEEIARSTGNGLNTLGLLGGTVAKWIERTPREWTDEDLAAWRNYCFKTVDHYKDDIHHWEIWNEPYGTFQVDAEAYVRVLKVAYEAAKEADPTCVIVGTCGPPWSTEWYADVFAAGGYEYQDIVSAHLYAPGGGNGPLDYDEDFRAFVAGIRKVMDEHGEQKEIWDTESGLSPMAPFNRLKRARYFSSYGSPVPIDVGTDMAARLYAIHAVEDVRFFYYLLHGSFEYAYALCENDGAPHPAVIAIAICAAELDGAEFVKAIQRGPVRAYAFRRGDDAVITTWGVGLAGRRSEFGAGVVPRAIRNVMGNEVSFDEPGVLPVTPSPLYLDFAASNLDEAIAALEAAPVPLLDPVAVELRGVNDALVGPAIEATVRNFETEPSPFTLQFANLPVGWELKPVGPFGVDREYVVHGERRLLFPIEAAEGAATAAYVSANVGAGGVGTPVLARIELPPDMTLPPNALHQPDAPLIHRGIEFTTAGPWTAKSDISGLNALYHDGQELIRSFYFYVARRGMNAALLNFQGATRAITDTPTGKRVTLARETEENGTCILTVNESADECVLNWKLSVPPTEEGWGELGLYIPEARLNGGYPCEVTVTSRGGAESTREISSEISPFRQLTNFAGLSFQGASETLALELEGTQFSGSNGVYFQDFRDGKRTRDSYRAVLGFGAVAGFEADITLRVKVTPTDG